MVRPVRWTVVKPLQWLVVKPLQFAVVKPLNYLVLAPLGYGFKFLPYLAGHPVRWLIRQTNAIEDTAWEQDLDRLAQALEDMGLVKVMDAAGKLALLLAIISWVGGGQERAKERNYQAWGVVNTAASIAPDFEALKDDQGNPVLNTEGEPVMRAAIGSTGEGGRTKAIQELYADGQSLAGLQAPAAYLPELNLTSQCFSWLGFGCLRSADLATAKLGGAYLSNAQLQGAYLYDVDLQDAFLADANLEGAELKDANLTNANLWNVNLSGVDFTGAQLSGAILLQAKLGGAINLNQSQLESTYLCGTALPATIDLPPNRDCDKLPQVLLARYNWMTMDEVQRYIDVARSQTPLTP